MSSLRAVVLVALLASSASAQSILKTIAAPAHVGANLGSSVAGAGDVNGDGFADTIAGAPNDDSPSLQRAGSARVISGFDGSTLRVVFGVETDAHFGAAVCRVGDVDGDGRPDFAVAAPDETVSGFPGAGRVRVYSGATGAQLYSMALGTALQASAEFGFSLDRTGDVNNDGIPDIVVGAPGLMAGGTGSGRVSVRSGADGSFLWSFDGSAFDELGSSVAGCGDIDQDGTPDFVAGAPGGGFSGDCYAEVRSGATHGKLFTIHAATLGDETGASVAGPGDVDGDGWRDVLVGRPAANFGPDSNAGEADVISGHGSHAFVEGVPGGFATARMGSSVAAVGDIDGDGNADWAAGAPTLGLPSTTPFVYVVHGSGGLGGSAYSIVGPAPGTQFGRAIDGAGDANGDGKSDVVVGAPQDGTNDAGTVRVYSGPSGSVLHSFTNASGEIEFGAAVALVEDIDGDGKDDVLVSSPAEWSSAGQTGVARVYSGANGSVLRTHVGAAPGERFGASLFALGDLNADGHDEYAIGAPQADSGTTDSGRVVVVNGASGATMYAFSGGASSGAGQLGWSVAAANDVNVDGVPDVIAGAPFSNGVGAQSGRAVVYSGATGSALLTFAGDSAGDQLGWSVGTVSDVNGDGHADLLAGAPHDGPTVFDSGAIWIVSGANGATLQHVAPFAQTGARLGTSVCSVLDVDGDGANDWAAGAPGFDFFTADVGLVILGSGATGASIRPLVGEVSAFGGGGEGLGVSVSRVGDVNNDGVQEVAAGASAWDSSVPLFGTNVGRVRVFSGKDGLALYSLAGAPTGGGFGASVAGRFDADGDGLLDLVGGAPSVDGLLAVSGQASVWSLKPAGVSTYGTGTPGCAGPQKAYVNSVPTIGNAAFQLNVSSAPPSALNLGLLADAKLNPGIDLFGLGFLWQVNPLTSQTLLALDVVSDAGGYGSVATPIPNVPGFAGATLYFQTVSLWGSACALPPVGLSSSKGLAFTLQ